MSRKRYAVEFTEKQLREAVAVLEWSMRQIDVCVLHDQTCDEVRKPMERMYTKLEALAVHMETRAKATRE